MILLLSLPSPPSSVVFGAGPVELTYHGLFIVLGILVGAWLTTRELDRRGYQDAASLAFGSLLLVLPFGLGGARFYHIVTEYDRYIGGPIASMARVWLGGLGIYGAVAGGFVGLLIFCRLRGVSVLEFADAAAPGLILGQAIGRWGNYFNQELFGRPSELPWAIRISPENRPVNFADAASFHPAFLYESAWNVLACLALLWVARRFTGDLKAGDVFLLYVVLYSIGRFLVETVRIDESFILGGAVRGNLVLSALLALGFASLLVLRHRRAERKRP